MKRYEYVRTFERADTLLPNTWIVVRIDGRGFHKSASSVSLRLLKGSPEAKAKAKTKRQIYLSMKYRPC